MSICEVAQVVELADFFYFCLQDTGSTPTRADLFCFKNIKDFIQNYSLLFHINRGRVSSMFYRTGVLHLKSIPIVSLTDRDAYSPVCFIFIPLKLYSCQVHDTASPIKQVCSFRQDRRSSISISLLAVETITCLNTQDEQIPVHASP